jgi:hypothetical protein
MKVQLNHPGGQKPFKLGSGYKKIGSNIIREWNNDNVHYRKFIQQNGYFVNGLSDLKPIQAELFFWGEWEGNSFFNPFNSPDNRILPNGLHRPFHSTVIRGKQNTDPYVFGEDFKYCVCKQKGQLTRLVLDDLILFGTVLPSINKFYIDTVFIIKDHDLSSNVQLTFGAGYTVVYKEETLEQLNQYLLPPPFMNNNRVYNSKTWWDDKGYFSFVPCKLIYDNKGFERAFIELSNTIIQLSNNSQTNVSYLSRCTLSSQDLWKEIVKICLEQGFILGVKFDEPKLNNCLLDIYDENGNH